MILLLTGKEVGLSQEQIKKLLLKFHKELKLNSPLAISIFTHQPYDIQRLLGHRDIQTTKIYAHLSPDYLKESVKKLD